MGFKEILKSLRIENSLSQKEVAEESNLSPQCISQLEMGTRNPTGSTLIALADCFDCSTDYLLGREDDFGNITVYQESGLTLSKSEQKIIEILRKKTPPLPVEWIEMYSNLPIYMQENIFAELKGMYLGYVASKSKNKKDLK